MKHNRSDKLTEPLSQKRLSLAIEHDMKLRSAIILSLVLHFVGYWALSQIEHTPSSEPVRFEVEITSQAGQQVTAKEAIKPQQKAVKPKAPVAEKKVVKPKVVEKKIKPKSTPKPKPVLTTESSEALDTVSPESLPEPVVQEESASSVAEVADTTPSTATDDTEAAVNQASDNASASNKTTNVVSEAEIWGGYGQKLYTMVGNNKRYPPIAVRRHWEGDVSVVAKFVEGVLVDVKLLASSGRKVLDDESIRMVKEAIEQTPITGNLVGKDFSVTIPVSFELY